MNKYKIGRKKAIDKWSENPQMTVDELIILLLATKPESDKESVYINDIPKGTIDGNFKISGDGTGESDKERCECKKNFYECRVNCPCDCHNRKPQEELEVIEPLKPFENKTCYEIGDVTDFLTEVLSKHESKFYELIKAHNALVKEVKRQNSEPTNVIKPHEAYCRKCLLWKEINKDGYCFNCLLTLSK